MLNISSRSQARRNHPAARLPCRQALKEIHSVKIPEVRNRMLPRPLTRLSKPNGLAKLRNVRTTKATANQPKAEYARGEKTRMSAISRTNSDAAAPPSAIGTFHAYELSGTAKASSGHSAACPERKTMYRPWRKKRAL